MTIPLSPVSGSTSAVRPWSSLAAQAKTERLLNAATEVFALRGLGAPMSEVAEAAGSGVASIYRLYPSKQQLLAALVIRRLDQITVAAAAAEAAPGDRWSALTGMLRWVVETSSADDFMGEARAVVADNSDVADATDRASAAWERLLAAAREEGRLRADASVLDLRLLFAATRAAKRVEPEQWPRMLALMIDALDSSPRPD